MQHSVRSAASIRNRRISISWDVQTRANRLSVASYGTGNPGGVVGECWGTVFELIAHAKCCTTALSVSSSAEMQVPRTRSSESTIESTTMEAVRKVAIGSGRTNGCMRESCYRSSGIATGYTLSLSKQVSLRFAWYKRSTIH